LPETGLVGVDVLQVARQGHVRSRRKPTLVGLKENQRIKPQGKSEDQPHAKQITPAEGVFTGGNGPVTGQETQISVNFTTPSNLPAGNAFPRRLHRSSESGHEMQAMEVLSPMGADRHRHQWPGTV
jgi:hypothetical protein